MICLWRHRDSLLNNNPWPRSCRKNIKSSMSSLCGWVCMAYERTQKCRCGCCGERLAVRTVCTLGEKIFYSAAGEAVGLRFLLIASQVKLSSSSSSFRTPTNKRINDNSIIVDLTTRNDGGWKSMRHEETESLARHLILSKMPNRDEDEKRMKGKRKKK